MKIIATLLVMLGTMIMILSVLIAVMPIWLDNCAAAHPAITILAGWVAVGMIGVGCAMITAEDNNG